MADKQTIDFHYIKVADFRTHHVDGAYGGITPQGQVHIDFYSERGPIPLRVRHEISSNGQVGQEVEREGKNGIVREVECGLMMNIQVAKLIRDWLTTVIEASSKEKSE